MTVLDRAYQRFDEEIHQNELGADNGHDIRYWSAYIDGAKAQKEESEKHGHFVFDQEIGEHRCSLCGRITTCLDTEYAPIEINGVVGCALKTPPYCKHCGAKMDGEKDE